MALINDIDELQLEISRLTAQNKVQQEALVKRFNSPAAIMGSIMSLFPRASSDGLKSSGLFGGQDFLALFSRLLLPLTLNKSNIRKSNFIVKGLVGLISQKASHYISADSVTGVVDRIKSLFSKKEKKSGNLQGYGIP